MNEPTGHDWIEYHSPIQIGNHRDWRCSKCAYEIVSYDPPDAFRKVWGYTNNTGQLTCEEVIIHDVLND